jgi:hypothetical protein
MKYVVRLQRLQWHRLLRLLRLLRQWLVRPCVAVQILWRCAPGVVWFRSHVPPRLTNPSARSCQHAEGHWATVA